MIGQLHPLNIVQKYFEHTEFCKGLLLSCQLTRLEEQAAHVTDLVAYMGDMANMGDMAYMGDMVNMGDMANIGDMANMGDMSRMGDMGEMGG